MKMWKHKQNILIPKKICLLALKLNRPGHFLQIRATKNVYVPSLNVKHKCGNTAVYWTSSHYYYYQE